MEMLLIALKEKIRLTKKIEYRADKSILKKLLLFSGIGKSSFFQTIPEVTE